MYNLAAVFVLGSDWWVRKRDDSGRFCEYSLQLIADLDLRVSVKQ